MGEVFRRLDYNRGVIPISRKDCDYYDIKTLSKFLKDMRASFAINAAGFTGKPNVDACESAKYECLQGNAVLPGIIREVCEDLKIPWGHISSGCVYSGRRYDGKGWTEEDEPNFSFRSLLTISTCLPLFNILDSRLGFFCARLCFSVLD